MAWRTVPRKIFAWAYSPDEPEEIRLIRITYFWDEIRATASAGLADMDKVVAKFGEMSVVVGRLRALEGQMVPMPALGSEDDET